MQPKRSLSDALCVTELNPEARAFLKGEAAAPGASPPPSPSHGESGPPGPRSGVRDGASPPEATPDGPASPGLAPPALVSATVSMTFRLPAELATALLRVSVERRLQNAEPFTQQGIVTVAVQDWLARHGGLKG